MPCACKNKGAKFEVIASNGRSVYQSSSKPSADAVAKRYPGSEVREIGAAADGAKTDTTKASPPAAPTP